MTPISCMCAQDNLWGVSSVSQSEGRHNDLHAYTCPQGYCRCTMATITNSNHCSSLYQSNNTDAQCACYRTGNGKALLNIEQCPISSPGDIERLRSVLRPSCLMKSLYGCSHLHVSRNQPSTSMYRGGLCTFAKTATS